MAKYLAPKKVQAIGICGAGVQGRMQLEYLKPVVRCRDVVVWGLNQRELEEYKKDMEPFGFSIRTTLDPADVASNCNLIVTATPSTSPLLSADKVRKGTHITAMGSDKAAVDLRIAAKQLPLDDSLMNALGPDTRASLKSVNRSTVT